MEFKTAWERYSYLKGIKQGKEEGTESAKEEGINEGRREGFLEMIELELREKFGGTGAKLLAKVSALDDVAALRKFARFLKKAESLAEVRDYLK